MGRKLSESSELTSLPARQSVVTGGLVEGGVCSRVECRTPAFFNNPHWNC